MKPDYNTFKSSLMHLERLQEFKIPFTRFWESVICSYGALDVADDSMCEFFLCGENEKDYKNIDIELEKTAAKLARLLYLKEQEYKTNAEIFTSHERK